MLSNVEQNKTLSTDRDDMAVGTHGPKAAFSNGFHSSPLSEVKYAGTQPESLLALSPLSPLSPLSALSSSLMAASIASLVSPPLWPAR